MFVSVHMALFHYKFQMTYGLFAWSLLENVWNCGYVYWASIIDCSEASVHISLIIRTLKCEATDYNVLYCRRRRRHPSVLGDDGVASIIRVYLHFLEWLCRPTRVWQSLPHLMQEKGVGCWRCLLRSFRLFLFSKAAVISASSANFAPCFTVCLQDGRSSAMLSHEWLSMLHRSMSLLQTSL